MISPKIRKSFLRRNRFSLLVVTLTILLGIPTSSVDGQELDSKIDFDRDVKPILSDRCYFCHGPDEKKREAGLRLDLQEEAFNVIESGDPDGSEMIRRIESHDKDEVMPPPESKITVTEDERKILRQWIEQGASWKKHWAFENRSKPVPPQVVRADLVGNGIDQFLLKQLESRKLSYRSPATKERLIRRVTFDLTGLPPTLAEVESFLADERSDAYEQVVDRLLASPHYGQRLASDWLDVARYSDTYGYQVDRDRFVWPWRDWVIRKFNQNQPYDQFIVEQIAGDLLPDPTDDQVLATTFNRLHPQKVEGGSVEEEFRVEYVADRAQTVATAFLGLTLECARCHDHKFDPISQKEYYQLFAFFNNIDEAGLYSYFTNSVPTPTLPLIDDATKKELARRRGSVEQLERNAPKIAGDVSDWYESLEIAATDPIESVDFAKLKPGRNQLTKDDRGRPAVHLTGDDAVTLKTGNFRRYQPFSISLSINTPDVKERAVVFHRSRAWTDAASRGYQLLIEDGKLSASLIHFWPGNAISVKTRQPIAVKQWIDVVIAYDGSSRASGIRIYLDGKLAETEVVRDHLTKNITGGGGDTISIGERFRDRGFTNGLVSEMKVFDRQLSTYEVALIHNPEFAKVVERDSNKAQRPEVLDMLREHWRLTGDKHWQSYLSDLQARRKSLVEKLDGLAEIMVMRELPEPRKAFVLDRGVYDQRSEEVKSGTPQVLPPLASDFPNNRLGLAMWMVDPGHPLTARVAVNHYWQLVFGEGIVRTPEDFGRQGAQPTHPELLDWLANDFVDHGWNVKRLLKQLVMTQAYQQSSVAPPELLKFDPDNQWLARAPSYRLSAEMLRDNVLAASGLLVDQIGGAPAKPYELAASFKPSKPDSGAGLYRRSLYTYWKRTGPAPVMLAFDAAKRDVCRVKRERTSSPLQALAMLNGPQFVEASRALADRLIKKNADSTSEQLGIEMFRTLTSRMPTQEETDVIVALYRQQVEYFSANQDQALAYLSIGKYGSFAVQPISLPANEHSIRIGADSKGGARYRGEVARVRILKDALPRSTVKALHSLAKDEQEAEPRPAIFSNLVDQHNPKMIDQDSPTFDGGFIEFEGTALLELGDRFTIEAWIKPQQLGGRIIDKITPGAADGFLLDLHQGLRLIVGNVVVQGKQAPELGRWSHVAAVVDRKAGLATVYLNGELVGQSASGPVKNKAQISKLAAWSSVANVLINHDECVTKR